MVSSLVNTPYVDERLGDPNVVRWRLRAAQTVDAATSRLFVDRFHAVSDGVKSENARALRIPLSKVTVAERGRNASSLSQRTPERQRRARLSFGLHDASPVILNVGRQEFQKAQLDLIRMSQQLTRQGREHRVLIAGKPGSASDVLIEALGDDGEAAYRVTLLGQRDDVGDLLAAADILVISSHFEGTAGAALEAMAVGTPIISTDVVGIRGILEHERNALLVPVSQPTEITKAVTRLLDDPNLAAQLAQGGKQDFAERFTLEHAAASMLHLYESVLSDTNA